jgi:esterase/lipase superfamily enzyme
MHAMRRLHRSKLIALFIVTMVGCGVQLEPLMPTPILYTEGGLDPLEHIPESERWTPRRVYFATVRKRDQNLQQINYTNTPSDQISFGLVLIGFGGPGMTWADLREASTHADRSAPVDLSIAGILEAGHVDRATTVMDAASPDVGGWFLEDLNDAIAESRDKDVLIYVHGAKVNFYNACAFAAQLDHFMGRDMTSVAFSWPSRQNIFAYAFGTDRQRAEDSGLTLATVIELLAEHTEARRIHIICWSAGARVLTQAFLTLRERHPDESMNQLRDRLRIGTAYFAAGDIERSAFIEALPSIHGLSDRTIVTVTSHDEALINAKFFMGGGQRLGQVGGELTEMERYTLEVMDRLEVIDVSGGWEDRGFDITGHRYWFGHPWASSDVVMSVRSDMTPAERCLVQGEYPILWLMPTDYPQRLHEQVQTIGVRREPASP